MHEPLRGGLQRPRAGGQNGGIASMTIEIHEQTLLLIPVSLAVGFMVWVLWNWWREEHRKTESRIEDRRTEDRSLAARHLRVINLPAQLAPSSEVRDWHRQGKALLH
jgi:hypothetical protein